MRKVTATKISVNGDQEVTVVPVLPKTSPLDCVDWDWAREFIGGWVEIIPISKNSWLMADDEGTFKSLSGNPVASAIAGRPIVGNAILVKAA
jgi:hypothetical protein